MYFWWYGLSYSLGFLGLFHWIRSVRSPLGLNVQQVYELTILIALGVLIGGRGVEVIFYEWAYYSTHLLHIVWIWLGGMSTHGILFGGTLGAWLFCRLHKKDLLFLADQLVVPVAVIMGLGRIGNFIDGQIVGSVADVWWAIKFPDVDGFRHPVVLYDGLKNILLIPVLIFIRRISPPSGVLLGIFLFGYGFFRIFIDFFREYRTEIFGLPPGQEFNIAMCVVGVILIIWAFKRGDNEVTPASRAAGANGPTMEVRRSIRIRQLILLSLLILPLSIPSDWTQDVPVRYGKRHEGMVHSGLYPQISAVLNSDEL